MLRISSAAYDDLRRHGEEIYPEECCGILIGEFEADGRHVHHGSRCRNACADSAGTRFEIDPRELIRTQREARERGLDIVGFYHSHPDRPAHWSATDRAEAHWIGCSYVITRVENGVAKETKSFVLAGTLEEDKALMEEELVVTGNSG
jgi:proteasome lid subunit RPN8/RPN11